MCYFLHVVTKSQLNSELVEKYLQEYDIYLLDMTSTVRNRQPGVYYTGILRGCSCDFVGEDPSKNSRNEILTLIKSFAAKEDVLISCVLDEGQFEDIGLDLQKAIDIYPKKEMTLTAFCIGFPFANPGNITYVIKKEELV